MSGKANGGAQSIKMEQLLVVLTSLLKDFEDTYQRLSDVILNEPKD